MTRLLLTAATIVLAGLVAGAMFGIWLSGCPAALSPAAYVEHQQHAIRGLNVAMPVLGGVTAGLTLVQAVLARPARRRAGLFAAAAVCFLGAGMVTRFRNQPINAVVMTWAPDSPPADWAELRDDWWWWHTVRTGLGVAGLALAAAAGVRAGTGPRICAAHHSGEARCARD
ncbi:MAG TPA: DUF1772 domain-containing protein [Urbifossiella sp.]|nr:DUF1772 domain-containing protein [Urbifossiella sp.]